MMICSSSGAGAALLIVGLIACERREPRRAPSADSVNGSVPASSTADSGRGTKEIVQSHARDTVEFFTARQPTHAADDLSRARATARTIATQGTYHYVEARRIADGVPEVHDDWTDVTIVHAGRATLVVGGRVQAGSLPSPGEHRGGTIIGGTEHTIGTGDLFVVPAGIPHQYRVTRGDSIRYLTIKVATRPRA